MIASRAVRALFVAVLLAGFGYRAFHGVRGGLARIESERLYYAGLDEEALPLLERAAVGFNRFRMLRRMANASIEIWQEAYEAGGPQHADLGRLADGVLFNYEALRVAPASRSPRRGLSEAYHAYEVQAREVRAGSALEPVDDPWTRVGRPGRIAVGLLRLAMERAPGWYPDQDSQAAMLWRYRIDDAALEAVRESARTLPLYWRHKYKSHRDHLPDAMMDAFAEAAWDAVDELPGVHPSVHLIELGKLERVRGELDRAMSALNRALAGPISPVHRAEAHLYLGITLAAKGEHARAEEHLERAAEDPAFRKSALLALADGAEAMDDTDAALGYLRRLRWENPGDLVTDLQFARVAGKLGRWPLAIQVLQQAHLNHPREPEPALALIGAYLAKGDPQAARELWLRVEPWAGSEGEMRRLWNFIERALNPN